VKRALNKVLPRRASYALIAARYWLNQEIHKRQFLGGNYHCPVCNNHIRTFQVIDGTAWCPICEAGERHRVDWIFMRDRTDLLDSRPKRMLHIAPEMVFVRRFNQIPNLSYLSVDLENPRAMERMDITNIPYPDDSFDVIYCSHVLEHIVEDRKAMMELHRVCKPGGWGLLQVPITADRTFEDRTVITPKERLAVFGQEDHVRRCGLDYVDRMKDAGFNVTHVTASELITPDQFGVMGILKKDRHVFFCRKLS
jgi:SAM-dependent methyltransferase